MIKLSVYHSESRDAHLCYEQYYINHFRILIRIMSDYTQVFPTSDISLLIRLFLLASDQNVQKSLGS